MSRKIAVIQNNRGLAGNYKLILNTINHYLKIAQFIKEHGYAY